MCEKLAANEQKRKEERRSQENHFEIEERSVATANFFSTGKI